MQFKNATLNSLSEISMHGSKISPPVYAIRPPCMIGCIHYPVSRQRQCSNNCVLKCDRCLLSITYVSRSSQYIIKHSPDLPNLLNKMNIQLPMIFNPESVRKSPRSSLSGRFGANVFFFRGSGDVSSQLFTNKTTTALHGRFLHSGRTSLKHVCLVLPFMVHLFVYARAGFCCFFCIPCPFSLGCAYIINNEPVGLLLPIQYFVTNKGIDFVKFPRGFFSLHPFEISSYEKLIHRSRPCNKRCQG